jgi:nucleoside phosphorylase
LRGWGTLAAHAIPTDPKLRNMAQLAHTHDDYTVGWICALPIELTAAMAMLDETHERLPQARSDHNNYTLGSVNTSMGKHNVAIACLPTGKTGIKSAAVVASQMSATFQSLRFGLMVGIGGGVPDAHNDIRLGDIVVSKPGLLNGGVVQYDFGKTIEEGQFIRTGSLNRPPTILLTALSTIIAEHKFKRYGYIKHLSMVPEVLLPEFSRPGADGDQLFEANYDHTDSNETCFNCNAEKLKERNPRDSSDPRVFYGTIASGNQVMRQGAMRDKIAKQFGGLCFEMEAAGLMDDFPCLVIRGICDYADSHKNKQWQPYAALTAAAYAKELLSVVSPESVIQKVPIVPITVSAVPSAVHHPLAETSLEEASSHPHSTSTTNTTNSFLVLHRRILDSSSVRLGRLVINTRSPWEDYYETDKPTDEDIGISLESQIRVIIENARGTPLYAKLVALLSFLLKTEDPFEAIESAQEKTYLLSNSGDWFRRACTLSKTRIWLENILKSGWDIYMVVGIHTIPFGNEEVIVAIQYRKVRFQWFWSRDVDGAFLEVGGNRWQPLVIVKNPRKINVGDKEILETTLEDAINEEEIGAEDDVYQIAGCVFYLNDLEPSALGIDGRI